ncbi:MAG: Uncharacterised protein [Polaribacter sp. SA4-10]|nr:MAG: Uncharacterised protein [Polaribacter sp. SA4-10]
MDLFTILILFSSIAFFYFGIQCFYSKYIISEFKRYGLPNFRKLTGVLQIMGAIGSLIGFYLFPVLLLLSSSGLHLLMVSGFIVRLKVKDSFIQSLPSFIFAILNLYIAFKTYYVYF